LVCRKIHFEKHCTETVFCQVFPRIAPILDMFLPQHCFRHLESTNSIINENGKTWLESYSPSESIALTLFRHLLKAVRDILTTYTKSVHWFLYGITQVMLYTD